MKHRWKAVGVLVALGGCVRGDDVPRADLAATAGVSPTSEAPAPDTHVEDAVGPGDSKPRPDDTAVTPPRDGDGTGPSSDETIPGEEPELVAHCARMRSLPSWCVERERARVRKRGTP